LRVGGGVGCRDIKAAGEIVRRPTGTDGAGADYRDAMDGFMRRHGLSLLLEVECGLWWDAPGGTGLSGRARRVRASRRRPARLRARPRSTATRTRADLGAGTRRCRPDPVRRAGPPWRPPAPAVRSWRRAVPAPAPPPAPRPLRSA